MKDLKEVFEKLKEKFNQNDLEFRVGATNRDKTMGLALCYVQARAIQERLDSVLGMENWTVSYKEVKDGFICKLSIRINNEWISKEDGAGITEYESVKGGISNAFKRVASSGFGIGRYLYNAKKNWFPIEPKGKGYDFISTPILELNEEKIQDKRENPKKSQEEIILNFGKYKGRSLKEIYNTDKRYIKYLIDKANDENIVNACKQLLVA